MDFTVEMGINLNTAQVEEAIREAVVKSLPSNLEIDSLEMRYESDFEDTQFVGYRVNLKLKQGA